MKKILIIFVALVAIAGGAFVIVSKKDSDHAAAPAAPVTPAITAAPAAAPATPAAKPTAAAPATPAAAPAALVPAAADAMAKPDAAQKMQKFKNKLIRISDVTLQNSQFGKRHAVNLPFSNPKITKGATLDFVFMVRQQAGDPTVMKVIPDDCVDVLEVNDLTVKVATVIGDAKRCDAVKGFLLDLKNYFHDGQNKVHILISNKAGPSSGLRVNFPSKADLAKEK